MQTLEQKVQYARQCGAGFSLPQAGAMIRLRRITRRSPAVRAEIRKYATMVGWGRRAGLIKWGLLDELDSFGV